MNDRIAAAAAANGYAGKGFVFTSRRYPTPTKEVRDNEREAALVDLRDQQHKEQMEEEKWLSKEKKKLKRQQAKTDRDLANKEAQQQQQSLRAKQHQQVHQQMQMQQQQQRQLLLQQIAMQQHQAQAAAARTTLIPAMQQAGAYGMGAQHQLQHGGAVQVESSRPGFDSRLAQLFAWRINPTAWKRLVSTLEPIK
jgi:hypothetical protein